MRETGTVTGFADPIGEREESGWYEIQWIRPTWTHGDERKAGPWFGCREDARDWTRHSQRISKVMLRTVRYEYTVVGAMTEDVARLLLQGECWSLVGKRVDAEETP